MNMFLKALAISALIITGFLALVTVVILGAVVGVTVLQHII